MVLVIGLLFAGNALADNSRFYGSFTYTRTKCGQTVTRFITSGNNQNNDLYLPTTGSSFTNTYIDSDGDSVTVSTKINGDSINCSEIGRWSSDPTQGWTEILTISFSNSYNNFTVTGNVTDDDPYNCNGPVSGSATRILNKPSTPTLSSPSNGSFDIALTPTLFTNAFSDPDAGDTHQQTEWQISTSSDFSSSVLHETSTTTLTSLTVPASALQEGTTYYWRAKFYDNRNTESDWSSTFFFTTLQTFSDTNENGIPDTLENDTVDLDGDGTADIEQTDVIKSLNTVVGSGQMGVSIKESTTVTQTVKINSIDPKDISEYVRPYSMPLGMLSFKLNVTNPGDTAYVKIHFSEAAPEDARWYFHDSINGWTDYSQYATFSGDRKSASVQLTPMPWRAQQIMKVMSIEL